MHKVAALRRGNKLRQSTSHGRGLREQIHPWKCGRTKRPKSNNSVVNTVVLNLVMGTKTRVCSSASLLQKRTNRLVFADVIFSAILDHLQPGCWNLYRHDKNRKSMHHTARMRLSCLILSTKPVKVSTIRLLEFELLTILKVMEVHYKII